MERKLESAEHSCYLSINTIVKTDVSLHKWFCLMHTPLMLIFGCCINNDIFS